MPPMDEDEEKVKKGVLEDEDDWFLEESDDETNYNLPAASDQWIEEVKALTDDEVA